MPQPPENEAGLTAPRPEMFPRDLNLGVLERAWWPFPVAMRPLAAAGRPGGCEHFPCLGITCNTPGWALNHGEHGIVKPSSWPPSGTHPPPGGVVPLQTDRHSPHVFACGGE